MNKDIYSIYENYKQIYVLEEGSMRDKIKAVIAASVILASGLQANDDRARMITDKIKNKPASELSQETPETVQAVKNSKIIQQTNSSFSSNLMDVGKQNNNPITVFVGLVMGAVENNPQLKKELLDISLQYSSETNSEVDSKINKIITNKLIDAAKETK